MTEEKNIWVRANTMFIDIINQVRRWKWTWASVNYGTTDEHQEPPLGNLTKGDNLKEDVRDNRKTN